MPVYGHSKEPKAPCSPVCPGTRTTFLLSFPSSCLCEGEREISLDSSRRRRRRRHHRRRCRRQVDQADEEEEERERERERVGRFSFTLTASWQVPPPPPFPPPPQRGECIGISTAIISVCHLLLRSPYSFSPLPPPPASGIMELKGVEMGMEEEKLTTLPSFLYLPDIRVRTKGNHEDRGSIYVSQCFQRGKKYVFEGV